MNFNALEIIKDLEELKYAHMAGQVKSIPVQTMQPGTRMNQALEACAKQIIQLDSTIQDLELRLEPVLHHSSPVESSSGLKAASIHEGSGSLVHTIREATEKLDSLNCRLSELVSRLDI